MVINTTKFSATVFLACLLCIFLSMITCAEPENAAAIDEEHNPNPPNSAQDTAPGNEGPGDGNGSEGENAPDDKKEGKGAWYKAKKEGRKAKEYLRNKFRTNPN
ncbi:hypothetical protein NEDG_00733 [Nematocida displodere]|uniref:Uncharacterized protein n=1 Tax=Nematocida displodere TaxID=1805483 RepID=A0A177EDX6_9MICR|nr:hypothetical protein NEDG_00733 [Nematocida displodere]